MEAPTPPEPPLDVEALDVPPEGDAPPPESDAGPVAESPVETAPDLPPPLSPLAIGLRLRPASAPSPAPPRPVPVAQPAAGRASLREIDAPAPPLVSELPEGATLVVQLEYTIAADGAVRDARVVSSSGDARLDESTRAFVVERWRYVAPGEDRRVRRKFVFTNRN